MTANENGDPSAAMPGPSIARFERLDFNPEGFNHEAHVYVAWQYVRQFDLPDAILRYRSTLKRLTQKLGVPEKYNETVTWFYLVTIAETLAEVDVPDWETWKQANPQVFRPHPGILNDYYSANRLNSEAARHTFLLPDIAGCRRNIALATTR